MRTLGPAQTYLFLYSLDFTLAQPYRLSTDSGQSYPARSSCTLKQNSSEMTTLGNMHWKASPSVSTSCPPISASAFLMISSWASCSRR